jgi:hypothetical protein
VTEPSLLVVCGTAFVAVLLLLSILAGVIRLIVILFPHHETVQGSGGIDPEILTAIHSAAAAAYPGSTVTRVEEVR